MSSAQRQAISIGVSILLGLVSLTISTYASYSRNDKDLTSRVTTVETRQEDDRAALRRIEIKVDRIYDVIAAGR